MGHLIYDVAASLDGYIAGPDGDVSAFLHEGPHVDAYQQRLQRYDTVVMGRATYEFGYAFGLQPGRRAYPHMQHVIFSSTIQLPGNAEVDVVRNKAQWLETIDALKQASRSAVYLCGGGQLAGYLLDCARIDRLLIKQASVVLGAGTALFAGVSRAHTLMPESSLSHGNGVSTLSFTLDTGS